MRYAISVILSLGVASTAFAMPRYDVEAHCELIAGFGGTYSNEMYNFCIQAEQTAYNGLRPIWETIPESIQAHCNQIASFGSASYEMLQFCIQEELNAAGNRQQFSFD